MVHQAKELHVGQPSSAGVLYLYAGIYSVMRIAPGRCTGILATVTCEVRACYGHGMGFVGQPHVARPPAVISTVISRIRLTLPVSGERCLASMLFCSESRGVSLQPSSAYY